MDALTGVVPATIQPIDLPGGERWRVLLVELNVTDVEEA
jgi:hypothetical protein